MSKQLKWQFELDEYIRQGEPGRADRSRAWKVGIGLQAVDGLQTSAYLLDTAKEHIEGCISIDEVQVRLRSYYEQRTERTAPEDDTREADLVAARIAEILGEKTFQFSPAEWTAIHRRLFDGVHDHAGKIRTYNIAKKEWILRGESVIYAAWDSIDDTLRYDFETERNFSYRGLSMGQTVKHLAKFTSDIWQIHPFLEGNTRATAVFLIKYLKTLGFDVNNNMFAEHSWYFRNALVRANYNDLKNGVHADTRYLEQFFENLLLGTEHELKNRYLHLDYDAHAGGDRLREDEKLPWPQSANFDMPKCQIDALDGILELIEANPQITQKELAEKTGKSLRTISRIMISLQEDGVISRVNGKRFGHWERIK